MAVVGWPSLVCERLSRGTALSSIESLRVCMTRFVNATNVGSQILRLQDRSPSSIRSTASLIN